MTLLRRLVDGVTRFWAALVVEPVRAGRLRNTGWPAGLTPVVAVGVVAFIVAVALIVAAPVVRELTPLSASVGAIILTLPRLTLPLIFWLIVMALALMQTAALHVRTLVQVTLTVTSSLALLFLGSLDLGPGEGGVLTVTPGKVGAVVAVMVIVILVLWRRRTTFAWWEFPVVLAVMGVSAVISLGRTASTSAPFGIDFGPTSASLVMSSIGQLAVPAALAAGVAVAEFAIRASTATVAALQRPRRGRRASLVVLLIAFVMVAVWRIVEFALAVADGGEALPPASTVLFSLAVLATIAMLWWGVVRVRGVPEHSVSALQDEFPALTMPVAIGLSILLAPVILLLLSVQVLESWGVPADGLAVVFGIVEVARSTTAVTVVRALVGATLVIAAYVTARRGVRTLPELLSAVGVITLASTVPVLAGLSIEWSSQALAMIVAFGTLVLTVVLAARRRLSARGLALLTVALLLSAAIAWREVIADPLSLVIGSTGIALVLFGFVWSFATDAAVTHDDSRQYPRATRVMLFIANSVFGVTVLAFGALARDLGAAIDLDAFAQFGDQLLGTALVLACVLAVWSAASSSSPTGLRSTVVS